MISHWIKMRKDLMGDTAVLLLSSTLGLSRREVVGLLHEFWSWADSNLADGTLRGLTAEHLDRLVAVPGFSDAMLRVGWLTISQGGLAIPRFRRHLGESAKRRSIAAVRAAERRFQNEALTISPVAPGDGSNTKEEEKPVSTEEEHILVDEIARHLGLGYAKAGRVVYDSGVTRDDWNAWLEYESRHGTRLAVQDIQRYRNPSEIPAPVVPAAGVRCGPHAEERGISRRSSFEPPGKFEGIE